MADNEAARDSNKINKLGKKSIVPQLTFVTIHIVSLAVAILIAVGAVVSGILSLVNGGGMIALAPFTGALIAAVTIIAAGITAKEITDKDMLKKGYSIAMAVLSIIGSIFVISAVAIIPFALFAVGAGSEVQKELWLHRFLPLLGAAVVVEAVVFLTYKLQKGMEKLVSIVKYVTLGLAGVALILSIIATFVGFYGRGNRCEDVNNFDSFSQWLNECSEFDF